MEDEVKKETSRLPQWKIESGHMYHILDALFIPILQVMHFQHRLEISSAIQFLSAIQEKSHSCFSGRVDRIRASSMPILLKHYCWCILAEIHERQYYCYHSSY